MALCAKRRVVNVTSGSDKTIQLQNFGKNPKQLKIKVNIVYKR